VTAGGAGKRQVFAMRLHPGAADRYRTLHRAVWPEVEIELQRCGIRRLEIFEADPLLVVYSEVSSDDAWARAWDSDVHRRWAELMQPLLEFDGATISATQMAAVYQMTTGDTCS
jgi:L-rhamnose mutarotase